MTEAEQEKASVKKLRETLKEKIQEGVKERYTTVSQQIKRR